MVGVLDPERADCFGEGDRAALFEVVADGYLVGADQDQGRSCWTGRSSISGADKARVPMTTS